MGLLDGNLSPEDAGQLALIGGLLSPGSFGQGLSGGIAGQQQVRMNAQELDIKKQALDMQKLQFAAALRNQNLINEYLSQGMGGAGNSVPAQSPVMGALGAGASQGDFGPTPTNAARIGAAPPAQAAQPGPFGGLPRDQWLPDLAFNGGKGIGGMVKDYNKPESFRPGGYAMTPSGQLLQLPQVPEGFQAIRGSDGQFKIIPVEGGPQAITTMAGAKETATARAKNAETPVPLERLDRFAGSGPGLSASVDDLLHPAPSGAIDQLPPALQQRAVADMRARGQPLSGMNVNGAPAFGTAGGMKSPADLAAEKLAAENSVKLQTEPGITYKTDQVKKASDYGDLLNSKVATGQDLMMRMSEARKALDQFQPGMGAEARLNIARAAQSLGLPDSIVKHINLGDVSAKQEFMKLSAQTAMESLKQSMGGAGRITQAEFKVFQQNNPNIELDKDAITKIYDFATRVYQREFAEQQARTTYIGNGGDPAQWPAIWAKTLDPKGTGDIGGRSPEASKATLRWNPKTGKIEPVN